MDEDIFFGVVPASKKEIAHRTSLSAMYLHNYSIRGRKDRRVQHAITSTFDNHPEHERPSHIHKKEAKKRIKHTNLLINP